jgi:hypothetical protein
MSSARQKATTFTVRAFPVSSFSLSCEVGCGSCNVSYLRCQLLFDSLILTTRPGLDCFW